MSMISAQIDELRELAGDGSMEWVAGPISASVLREAADTIWQLRDDLQRANAENAKLHDFDETIVKEMDVVNAKRWKLVKENAKLRELVKYAYECAVHSDHATCDDCERINECCILVGRMRELGVEVD